MRRLLLVATALSALIACGLTFNVAHPDRVDAGKTFVVTLQATATDAGTATPGVCAGIPWGWTIDGPVTYTLTAAGKSSTGEAAALQDHASATAIDEKLSWSCWATPSGSFAKTDAGTATLRVKVPKEAKGSYGLQWIVDYDISDGVSELDVQKSTVFVGSAKLFSQLEGKKTTDALISTLAAPRSDLSGRRPAAEAWLAGTANLNAQNLYDDATSWKALHDAVLTSTVRVKALKVAPEDKKRAKAAVADAQAELDVWTPLWSKLLIGAGAHIQQELNNLKNSDGTYGAISSELDSTIGLWLRAFDTVGSIEKLDPQLDAGLMEVLLLARFAPENVQVEVSDIALRLAQGKQAKAVAYFVQASSKFPSEGKDGPNVRASCALAIKTAKGTEIADDMKAACAP